MNYVQHYDSPLGRINMTSDGNAITGLWFDGQERTAAACDGENWKEKKLKIFDRATEWLDLYFLGKDPGPIPPIKTDGTAFREEVWNILKEIPYGETMTYGQIAKMIADKRGIARMSSQAVGGAVGDNPILILIPCHRVVGANGELTGYAAGIEKKQWLLEMEGSVSWAGKGGRE